MLLILQLEIIKKVFNKFNMHGCKINNLLVQLKLQLACEANDYTDNLPYREPKGYLRYRMLGPRADLSFIITYFSQF